MAEWINEIKETLEEWACNSVWGFRWPPKHAELFLRGRMNYATKNGKSYWRAAGTTRPKGQHDRAIAAYGEAIQLNPRASTFYDRGNTYNSKEDYDLAIPPYSEAIRLNPKEALTGGHRGEAYMAKEDYDHAIRRLQ